MKNKLTVLWMASAFLFIPFSAFSGFVLISHHYSSFPSSNIEKIDNLEMKASIDQDKALREYSDNSSLNKKTAVLTRFDKASNWYLDYNNKVFREEAIVPLSTSKRLSDKNLKKFKVSFKKIGTNVKVGMWNCEHYALFVKDKILFEVWASPFKDLGLPDSDIEVLKDFYSKVLDKGVAPFLKSNSSYKEMIDEMMIIKSVSHQKNGDLKEVMMVQELAHQDFSPDLFEIPEGFRRSKY